MSETRSGNYIGEVPLILSLSPRGEGTLELPAAEFGVLSPLGERDRVRGEFAKHSAGIGTCR